MNPGGPADDQIEINVFGPGFGESSAIHVGSSNWIIIDSCIDSESQSPAAINYLRNIGVNIEDSVKIVIATHWHDDHIRGLARTFEICRSARFCSSAALTRPEFLQVIETYNTRHDLVAGSGTSELCKILRILEGRAPRTGIKALGVRKIFEIGAADTAHGHDCEVFTLSPSDAQFDQAIINLAKLLPVEFTQKIRAPTPSQNDLSIAAWISVGPVALLFGADLEENGNPELGWSAIVGAVGLPRKRAKFFKIPHHGSSNGHHDRVWAELLDLNPFAVLTPWTLNKGLPKISDVQRIISLTNNGFSTSNGKLIRSKRRSQVVEKTLRISGINLVTAEPKSGQIRMRNGGTVRFSEWTIELSDAACALEELDAPGT